MDESKPTWANQRADMKNGQILRDIFQLLYQVLQKPGILDVCEVCQYADISIFIYCTFVYMEDSENIIIRKRGLSIENPSFFLKILDYRMKNLDFQPIIQDF